MTDTTPAATVRLIALLSSTGSGTYPQLLYHRADGDLELWDSALLEVAAATTPFTADTWQYLRIAVECDTGAATLRWRVWEWSSSDPRDSGGSWGSPIIDYTQSSTGITSLARISHGFQNEAKGISAATQYYIDDSFFFAFDDEADLPAFPATVERIKPDGNSATNTAFSAGGSGTNPDFADVDDDTIDDATTDDRSSTSAGVEQQSYTMEACPTVAAGDTVYVAACTGWANSTAAGNNQKILVREHGTNTLAPSIGNVSTSYLTQQYMMATAPSDGAAWTSTRVDGLEVGANKGAGTTALYLTMVWALIVRIIAAPAGGQPILRRSDYVSQMALGQSALRRRY
jgi:hypothetical protein